MGVNLVFIVISKAWHIRTKVFHLITKVEEAYTRTISYTSRTCMSARTNGRYALFQTAVKNLPDVKHCYRKCRLLHLHVARTHSAKYLCTRDQSVIREQAQIA